MAYSDFTLNDIKQKFQMTVEEKTELFPTINEVPASAWLAETLKYTLPLALAISSEKARSELLIAPVLVELRNLTQERISLFSGTNFNVDAALGLTGYCDFIVSRSPEQLAITAPVLIAVEAKNENINAGLPQCMAIMIAAGIFNEREGHPISPLYGVVTTGTNWRFLRLQANTIVADRREYHIGQVGQILGILRAIADDDGATATQPAALTQRAS
jgi:hypothetical protein